MPRLSYVGHEQLNYRVFPQYYVPLTYYIHENGQNNITQKIFKTIPKYLLLLFENVQYFEKKNWLKK